MIAAADFGLGTSKEVPELLELAINCDEYHALPFSGGVLEQPGGLMRKLRQVLNVYRAHRAYKTDGQKPGESAKWKSNHQDIWEIITWVDELREKSNG